MFGLLRRQRLDLGVQVNHRLDLSGRWVRTDFRWLAPRVVVEVDGWGSHGGCVAFAEDLDRELDLRLGGWTVLRFGWRQVVDRPDRVARLLSRTLGGRS